MRRGVAHNSIALRALSRRVRLVACLTLLACLAACGGHPTRTAHTHYSPSRYYPPPGPHEDPWGPYIHEASGRFGVPELWVRRVMRQESGGQEDVISWAGAMGLMQVMPDTYSDLRGRYSLGDDPFDPRNNILAGTAYLREMYDRYGAPGFLAAYNAGPNRLDRYLNNGTPLPEETINYVALIAPSLGAGTPLSGPLAVYADRPLKVANAASRGCDPDAAYNPDGPCTPAMAPIVRAAVAPPVAPPSYATSGCNPDAAYDPSRPCAPLPASPVVRAAVAPPVASPSYTAGGCDPDAAYDPSRPCARLPASPAVAVVEAPPRPTPYVASLAPRGSGGARPIQETMARPGALNATAPGRGWAIQVGAYANLSTAQAAAERARSALPDLLRTAYVELPPTTPLGTQVAFRARLAGLSALSAIDACARLGSRGVSCMTVPPSGAS